MTGRIFLLSPANCGGARARQALSPNAQFALAAALRSSDGAPLGELFSFVSGLYFRGKLTYARRFARPADPDNPVVGSGIHIITANAGLRSPDTLVTRAAVQAFGQGDIDANNARYRRPLEASARALLAETGADCEVVLLGSVASPKYVDILTAIFGARLLFPIAFVGRGDMSRGGLLLRHASNGTELDYVPVLGAALHGARPAKLPPPARMAGPQERSTQGRSAGGGMAETKGHGSQGG
ncbi:MAG TPA: hypothetical protein VHT95_08255 [Vicinamibacterales bacterium]|nr:hypothetical protein [Vicinamibacterales bacterium]